MDKWELTEGDDQPAAYFQIRDAVNDLPVDLSDANYIVTAKFREKNATVVLQTVVCTKMNNGVCGWVKFAWPATALDDLGGFQYEIEISVDFDGEVQTCEYYYWEDDFDFVDPSKTIPIKIREEF